MRVLPSPVRISAIWPSCRTMPPISCTSKWRIAHRAPADLARERERLGQQLVERSSPSLGALAQLGELLLELVVLEQLELGLPGVDPLDALGVGLELLRFAHSEGALEDGHSYLA